MKTSRSLTKSNLLKHCGIKVLLQLSTEPLRVLMEGSTTIEELCLAVTQYAKEGTEDRDIIEKFCIEYINLLEEDSSILDRADFKESFFLINEIGMNT